VHRWRFALLVLWLVGERERERALRFIIILFNLLILIVVVEIIVRLGVCGGG